MEFVFQPCDHWSVLVVPALKPNARLHNLILGKWVKTLCSNKEVQMSMNLKQWDQAQDKYSKCEMAHKWDACVLSSRERGRSVLHTAEKHTVVPSVTGVVPTPMYVTTVSSLPPAFPPYYFNLPPSLLPHLLPTFLSSLPPLLSSLWHTNSTTAGSELPHPGLARHQLSLSAILSSYSFILSVSLSIQKKA